MSLDRVARPGEDVTVAAGPASMSMSRADLERFAPGAIPPEEKRPATPVTPARPVSVRIRPREHRRRAARTTARGDPDPSEPPPPEHLAALAAALLERAREAA